MNRKPLKRRALRIIAIQSLFQLDMSPEMSLFDAVRLALHVWEGEETSQVEDLSNEELLTVYPELDYALDLIQGVDRKKEQIDQAIKDHLKGWEFSRVVKLDLMIMRVSIYEMISPELEVPKPVALNEAIKIAKLYSDEKSAKFINGVLSNLI